MLNEISFIPLLNGGKNIEIYLFRQETSENA